MTIQTIKYSGLILASIVTLAGCPSDDTGGSGETDDPTTSPSTTAPSTSSPSTSSPSTSATDSMSGTDTMMTATESDTDTATDSSSSSGDPNAFMFRDDPPDAYTQIDRMGLPAVNTALNLLGDKDAFNAASPAEDIAGDFDDNFLDSVEALHVGPTGMAQSDANGLNDDLDDAGFTVCDHDAIAGADCRDQWGPFVVTIGDQIPLDTAEPSGFPNGRQPQNAVIDVLLALLLLDIAGGTHDGTEFAAVPLNPDANDVAFPDAFPWFAPAN